MASHQEKLISEIYGNMLQQPQIAIAAVSTSEDDDPSLASVFADLRKIYEYSEKLSCLLECCSVNVTPEQIRSIAIAAEHLSEVWHKVDYEQNI